MKTLSTVFLSASMALLLTVSSSVGTAQTDVAQQHATGFYNVPNELATNLASALPSVTGLNGPTIVIRYLGYNCSHCVRQLAYLNQHAEQLRTAGVSIVAVSDDDAARSEQLLEKFRLNRDLFVFVSDADLSIATNIGARRVVNDSILDLHATIVIDKGQIRYATMTAEPDMDIERIVAAAAGTPKVLATSTEFLDRYLKVQPTVNIVAGPADGIREPLDLDFNRSYLHPNDLWVVLKDTRGHGMAIVHEATSANPIIRLKKDSRANHFMWRTMALSMGTNGAFATAQNGEPGDNDLEYMFMGPTLWSSDTAVFASRYQDDNGFLASHLDMLHQSPYDLGIAHDSANVYWVLDSKYPGISRYDFQDPHEVGGTDHRDGIIRRYIETSIKPAERGRPAHVALDKRTGYLYYIDPGKNEVHCLDTRTGTVKDSLVMPASSAENVAEFTSVVGATFWNVIPASAGLKMPIGIDVVGSRLLVGDAATGRIYVFAWEGQKATSMGYIETNAKSLHGIVVGPDQRIWFVDKEAGTVCRLDVGTDNTLSAVRGVRVSDTTAGDMAFVYTNSRSTQYQPQFVTRTWTSRTNTWSAWSAPFLGPTIASSSSKEILVSASMPDTTSWYVVELAETDNDQGLGLRAQTAIVPLRTRKVLVQDERNGVFDVKSAVEQTTRKGYTFIPSDIFTEIADSLPYLKTMLWNSGSFGEISPVDDAIIRSCISRNVDIFLMSDDPLALRTDMPQSVQFFRDFGVSFRGAEKLENDDGQRLFRGVAGDTISGLLPSVQAELPRLDHHRGGKYVPNVLFRLAPRGKPILTRVADSVVLGARYEVGTYRSIIVGINGARFLDGGQRTILLDKGLTWLEQAGNPDTVFTGVTVGEAPYQNGGISISAHVTPQKALEWSLDNSSMDHTTVELYASTGQKIGELFSGKQNSIRGTYDCSRYAAGCYFLIVRSNEHVAHATILLR